MLSQPSGLTLVLASADSRTRNEHLVQEGRVPKRVVELDSVKSHQVLARNKFIHLNSEGVLLRP